VMHGSSYSARRGRCSIRSPSSTTISCARERRRGESRRARPDQCASSFSECSSSPWWPRASRSSCCARAGAAGGHGHGRPHPLLGGLRRRAGSGPAFREVFG
jgi:hypothetical protein